MRKLCVGLACSLLLLASPGLTRERRVALVDPDPELDHAVALSLSPWGVAVVAMQESAPGTDLPAAAARARALARQWQVSAVVWVTAADQGSLLWIYEADTDSVSTRQLAEAPPFSSPDAASVALTLKSLLRTSELGPEREEKPPPPRPKLTPPAAHPERLTLTAELNSRYSARQMSELRGALSGVWWPGVGAAPARFGVGLGIGAGPGVDIERLGFSGQFRQLSLSAIVTWQVVGNRYLASSLFGGGSGHFVELVGFDRQLSRSTDVRRVTPSLDAGTEVAFSPLTGTSVGLGVKALYFPRPERYLVRGQPLLELWPVAAEFGVRLGVNLL